jgi:predicted ArsR family transcriptional regulator
MAGLPDDPHEKGGRDKPMPLDGLSSHEQILRLLASGRSIQDVANQLGVPQHRVRRIHKKVLEERFERLQHEWHASEPEGNEPEYRDPLARISDDLYAMYEAEYRDPLYGPRLSDDLDALSSTLGWAPWMRLFRRHEQRLVDRRRAAREPQERATPAA